MENKIDELQKKIRENSLVISRVPKKTKENFIAWANEEFCGDYGMTLKMLVDKAIEYQAIKATFFENIDMKLDSILGIISQPKPEKESGITLLSGKKIKSKEVKNE